MKQNSIRAWVLAARPKTLSGAASPVLVGGMMAWIIHCLNILPADFQFNTKYDLLSFDTSLILPFVLCLLFALLMQIDANFINDYYDFKKGTDREDRLGPERACAQGWITPEAMMKGIIVTTVLSVLTGIGIMLIHMQWELLLVGALCVLTSFLYTTHFSYQGLGDLLVVVFFGIVPVCFTYYVMTNGDWSLPVTMAGLAVGLATDNLLMVNNYRDRNQDAESGKRTVVVKLIKQYGQKEGEQASLDIYLWLGVCSTLIAIAALFMFPFSSIHFPVMLIYLILHFRAFREIKTKDGRDLNSVLAITARNIFLFGVLFAVSLLL